MNFLKQNLFLVCIVLAMLVLGGVLVKMYGGYTAEGKALIDGKLEIGRKINNLRRSNPLVNEAVVRAAQARVEKMKEMRQRVAEDFLARNQAGRMVMTFRDSSDPTKQLHAFPIEEKLYNEKGLRLEFPKVYTQQVRQIWSSMSPTRPPTVEEIQIEAAAITERTAPMPTDPTAGAPTPVPASPHYQPRSRFEISPEMGNIMGNVPLPPGARYVGSVPGRTYYPPPVTPTPTPAAPAGTATEPAAPLELTPAEKAYRLLVSRQAGAGEIYADPSTSMDIALVETDHPSTPEDRLWQAQLSLWVQQDIAAAIRDTNAAYKQSQGGKGREEGVPSSAVKRLVSTHVLGYVMNQAGTAGGMFGPMGPVAFGGGAPPSGDPTAGGVPGAASTKRLVYLDRASTMGPGGGGSAAYALTQRHCNPIYDVVHYEFTAIIAATELIRLEKSLMARNNHTVLHVETSRVGAKTQDRSGAGGPGPGPGYGGAAPAAAEEMYYYGTDPVVQVRIVGELLMLTDWTRGREKAPGTGAPGVAGVPGVPRGDSKIAWDERYPPLMPVKVLQRMNPVDASALRDVDRRRVGSTGGSTGSQYGPGGY